MLACAERDAAVARDLRVSERPERHEWVVFGGDDESRHADALDHAHRAGAMIVVFSVREAEVGRRIGFVELANGPDLAELPEVEETRPEPLLAPHF